MAAKTIHILEMEKHFLYLPLYFAKHKDFFGYLPKDVHVEIDPCEDHTDKSTYAQMMSESSDHEDIVMAITDPIQIFNTPLSSKRKPAVLATLVTNGAFWAINHGTHEITGFRDLDKFDRVIAYGPGTTSYSIAQRIARDSGKKIPLKDFIEVVEPGTELTRFSKLQAGENTFALSPNILRIEGMKAKIELPLGTTDEYNDVLVTSLVTYNDYVRENKEIVIAIVMGIQKALLMTRRESPEVIQFAKNKFYYANKVARAIRMSIEAGAFPTEVQVAKSHWKAAAKAHYGGIHPDNPWTRAEEENAWDYYRECIEPYEHITEHAVKNVSVLTPTEHKGELEKGKRRQWTYYGGAIAPFTSALIGIVATQFIERTAAFIILLACFLAWGITRLIRRPDYVKIVFWVSLIFGVILTPLPWISPKLHDMLEIILPLGIGFFVGALTTGIEYARSAKE